MMKKVCLIASSGGHFEQILNLKRLNEQFDVFFVTEKTKYTVKENTVYYVDQINRSEFFSIIKLIKIFIQSMRIFFIEKPDILISTGALSVVPMFIIGKCFKKKLIFIESFAKVNTGTMTGKFVYKFADVFIVQWKSMLKIYPNAKYLGSIY